jgi:hypothetical protein
MQLFWEVTFVATPQYSAAELHGWIDVTEPALACLLACLLVCLPPCLLACLLACFTNGLAYPTMTVWMEWGALYKQLPADITGSQNDAAAVLKARIGTQIMYSLFDNAHVLGNGDGKWSELVCFGHLLSKYWAVAWKSGVNDPNDI